MKSVRVHWDEELGWVIDVPFALSKQQLQSAIDFSKRYQLDRIRCMPHGDRRERSQIALDKLTTTSIRQQIIPAHAWEKDRIVIGRP